jgi:hypothetical protein
MLNQRVMVYFNLHRGLWSIKSLKTKLVIGHSNTIILRDVEPKVSEAGRQRVIKEKKKKCSCWFNRNSKECKRT